MQPEQSRPRAVAARFAVGLAFVVHALLLGLIAKDEVMLAGNEASRLATAQAMIDEGTFVIDRSMFRTVDRMKLEGEFYSDKPLLLSAWLAGVYAPIKHLAGVSFSEAYNLCVKLVTVFGITSFSVLLSLLFYFRLRSRGASGWPPLALSLAVVWTTWILSFGTTVNNHTPAAALLFALVWATDSPQGRPGSTRAFFAGILAGVVFGVALPVGAVFFCASAAALQGWTKKPAFAVLGAYVSGFAVAVALQAGLNFFAYGTPLPGYMIPGVYDFPENIHSQSKGGLFRPENPLENFFQFTLGYRGAFSHMPVLFLGFAFFAVRRLVRFTDLVSLLGAAALLVFYALLTGDFGGWSYGFRYAIPVGVLFFWWASLWLLDRPTSLRATVFVALCVIGLFTSVVGAINPWPVCYEGTGSSPEAIEQEIRSPLMANILYFSFDKAPDGPVFNYLAEEVYGRKSTVRYLYKAIVNTKRPDLMIRLRALGRKWAPPGYRGP